MKSFIKFYYLADMGGINSQLFTTKKAALDWIKDTDKNTEDEYDTVFEKHELQVMHVRKNTKKDMLEAMRNVSLIVGTRIFTPEIDYD